MAASTLLAIALLIAAAGAGGHSETVTPTPTPTPIQTSTSADPVITLKMVKKLQPSTVRNVSESVRFRCEVAVYVDGEPHRAEYLKKVKFKWYKFEAPLPQPSRDDRFSFSKKPGKETAIATLKIKELEVLDTAEYKCEASLAGEKVSSAGVLRVLFDGEAGKTAKPASTPSLVSLGTSDGEIAFTATAPDYGEEFEMSATNATLERSTAFATSATSTVPTPPAPVCQVYKGGGCSRLLADEYVFVPEDTTQEALEEKLSMAFRVISYSNEISSNCEGFAVPSLCYSTFPVCRTPEETNAVHAADSKALGGGPVPWATSGRDRSALPLRRVCREDCEMLENEICQKEYAIAKRHPEIGRKLTLEECSALPESGDCLEIGIDRRVPSEDSCYWEDGAHYRGNVAVGVSGSPCTKWSRKFNLISNHPELSGGHNYCRNPGGRERQPWCFVDRGTKDEKEPCDVPKCSVVLWFKIGLGVVLSAVGLAVLVFCLFCANGGFESDATAIRNINLPNADKNIYGDSRLNSPMELADLAEGRRTPQSSARGDGVLRVRRYNLSQIEFVEELGEGAFGKVYKGRLVRETGPVFVAVKALKENASAKTRQDFKREIELISELRHENIVCILGVVLREEPMCMLFEFMARGDLHEFLMQRGPPNGPGLSPVQFTSIARHVASGMEYLAAHHYVHRDLAARNCLVADDLTVKISDFGLSRDIYSSDYYRVQSKSLLPVRWMPPESILYGKFTTESDVWSYGVVLWEIYSYGLQPYYGYSNQEVIAMVRERELLQCPSACPRNVYNLMRECWHQTPAKRPNFTMIVDRLTSWLRPNSHMPYDNTSDSSGANSSHRAPPSVGDPRERIPLIGHNSSSNGSLAGSMPRKLSTAGSVKSHASNRLMVSGSDVTSSSDNLESSMRINCGPPIDGQSSEKFPKETIIKIPQSSISQDI